VCGGWPAVSSAGGVVGGGSKGEGALGFVRCEIVPDERVPRLSPRHNTNLPPTAAPAPPQLSSRFRAVVARLVRGSGSVNSVTRTSTLDALTLEVVAVTGSVASRTLTTGRARAAQKRMVELMKSLEKSKDVSEQRTLASAVQQAKEIVDVVVDCADRIATVESDLRDVRDELKRQGDELGDVREELRGMVRSRRRLQLRRIADVE